MRERVYSYLRFSDAKQAEGYSTERQTAYAEAWAKEHGLQLDAELSMRDEGLSAYHQTHVKRGALGVFLAAVESGHVPTGSVLVVEGLDRLSRAEPIQAQAQLASIINAGITVVTASDNKVYSRERLKANPMDLVYSLLVMIRAHEESDTKSKRVRDAIRRQCLGWQSGAFRGLVRYGQAPSWLKVVDGQWQPIPERVAALRAAVAMFLRGLGSGAIAKRLHEEGLSISGKVPSSGHLVRLLPHPALVGDKHVELDGETYVLADYYPPVITREEQAQVLQAIGQRGRRRVKGDIPSLITGMGITVCGYCGAPMKAQTMANKRKVDGTILDCNRRLQCTRVNHGERCSVAGSCSVVPIERAIMGYCSDLVNLQALSRGDRTAAPRAELAAAHARLLEIETQLTRLTDALLQADAGQAPSTFLKRARELEAERAAWQDRAAAAERDLAESARADIEGVEQVWKSLAKAVLALDMDARLQARQLVADTFERITVYHKGTQGDNPRGVIDVLLVAKGGHSRMLSVDAAGAWLAGEVMEEEIAAE